MSTGTLEDHSGHLLGRDRGRNSRQEPGVEIERVAMAATHAQGTVRLEGLSYLGGCNSSWGGVICTMYVERWLRPGVSSGASANPKSVVQEGSASCALDNPTHRGMTAANTLLTSGIDCRSGQYVSLGLQRLCWSSLAYRCLIWSDLPLQGMSMLIPCILHGDTGRSFATERKLASDLTWLFLRTSH